jgi:hypothetical protein
MILIYFPQEISDLEGSLKRSCSIVLVGEGGRRRIRLRLVATSLRLFESKGSKVGAKEIAAVALCAYNSSLSFSRPWRVSRDNFFNVFSNGFQTILLFGSHCISLSLIFLFIWICLGTVS